jgi:hypothetical protein
MRTGRGRAIALTAVNVALFVMLIGLVLVSSWEGGQEHWFILPIWLAVGSVLILRRPDNAVGWVFSLGVLAWVTSGVLGLYASYGFWQSPIELPGLRVAYWLSTWTWVPGLILVPTLGVLLFPAGRLPSRRWRPVAWAALVGTGLLMAQYTMVSWIGNDEFPPPAPGVENPLHVPGLAPYLEAVVLAGGVLIIPAVLASFASLVVRFRRAVGVERQQLRWVTFAVTVSIVLYLSGPLLVQLPLVNWAALSSVAFNLFPIAMGVAVLRYRLFEIDRVISRTVSYALVTLLLAGVYVVGVVGLGALARGLGLTQGGDLVVAASTLAVAALFHPVRRRVQGVVDHRFDRAHYDAARTVDAFGQRLRDEVDLEALSDELRVVAVRCLAPAHASLFLMRGRPA